MIDRIIETEIQGIRTVLTTAPPVGSDLTAGLIFRVGRADETLVTAGLTHLVEHLALHGHGLSELHYNGATADMFTMFHVHGSAADLVAHLNGVCASLNDLPLHRLDTEREILRTEAAGRDNGPALQRRMMRYGAQGHGLVSYNEVGLHHLDAATVTEWARTRFTRENAVLWISAPEPLDGLDLPLPSGPVHPPPPITSALPKTPAWYPADENLVFLESVVERSTTAAIYSVVLARALYHDLRQQGGYSYTATADYEPRDGEHARIIAMADCLPASRDAVVGGFIDVLARLRLGTITDDELASAKAIRRRLLDEPNFDQLRLPAYALNLLMGHENLSLEQLRAEVEGTTVEAVQEVARQSYADALVQAPAGDLEWTGLTLAPQWSTEVLHGKAVPPTDPSRATLIVADEGLSLTRPEGAVTIRYDNVAAVLAYPDGGRHLTSLDGFSIGIEPNLDGVDGSVLERIDASVPRDALIRMPPRDADRIPAAPSKEELRDAAKARKAASRGPGWFSWTALAVSLAATIGILGSVVAVWTLVAPSGRAPQVPGLGAMTFFLVYAWYRRRQLTRD